MTTDLWKWTAAELADGIAAGRITSVEATESALARMAQVNPALNAVVDPLEEQAMEAARAADATLRTSGPSGPLHGVPVTVKINVDYGGRATTNGVVAQKDNIAASDGSVVQNMKAAGAVILGRTNTPCYSMRAFTNNDLHGATYNPHDKTLTPGGSSGGAGSATAAGIGAIGHGNDIGGSVRYPAYACGVYGLRPTSGLLAATSPSVPHRMIVSQMASVQGPLARSIEDIRLGALALSGHDPRDIWQVPAGDIFGPLGHAPCKVAMLAETDEAPVDPEVSAAIRQAGAILADAGYTVEEVTPPSFAELMDYWRLILGNEMRAGLQGLMMDNGDWKMKKSIDLLLEGVPELDSRDAFLKALTRRSALLVDWQMFFQKFPLVLTATTWAKPMIDDYDVSEDADAAWFYGICAPLSGTPIIGLPGLSVPVGSAPGKPMGVQLLSDRFQDKRLLEAGAVLERAIGAIAPIDPIGF
ncbi:amidase [Maritimibacter alkaliphilus]|uniref:amidase n=1 Tax=Maritimibacter alkaliphilus TaxID=404236 RepID=UPI001C955749|nr:amidase [Maritimibacter alkaliphilus]MBY6092091.1 amidase [Maritimibacter alkaliphilus]